MAARGMVLMFAREPQRVPEIAGPRMGSRRADIEHPEDGAWIGRAIDEPLLEDVPHADPTV